jgi:hypothetical protein
MSQHDFNIANQGFPAFRGDLNNALVALATNSSGATAPATTYANQFWYDTDTDILKLRTADDTAWLEFAAIDQTTGDWTLTHGVIFGDNVKANFGAGSDLQIFHDGINSYIDDAGNGDMLIRGSARILLRKAGTTENMIHAEADSYVKLFYDNAEKLATSATGIQITGTALATTNTATLTGDTTLDFAANQNFVLTLGASLTLLDPTTEQVGQSGFIVFIQDGTGTRGVSLDPQYKTAGGVTLALSGAAGAIDVVPYIVSAGGSILLGTPQLAFA